MKKVLIITYYWPPSGGAGVQRWLKFVKYLREFGWEPIVYTVSNGEYPVLDLSLEKDIPKELTIIKTPIWEPYSIYKKFIGQKKEDKINPAFLSENKKPKLTEKFSIWLRGNFFIPDARIFWVKPSIKFLSKYLKENPVDAIVSSGPPHSTHLIALKLKSISGTKWVADFRDPWTNIDFYKDLMLTKCADQKHHRLEKKVLSHADEVITIGQTMADEFNKIVARNYQVITNGFDDDDIVNTPELDKKFTIAHIGTLVKDRNPEILWKALSQLVKNEDFSSKLEIKLVGKVDFYVLEQVKSYGLEDYLNKIEYIPHNEVIRIQQSAQVLLLLLNNTPNAKGILTGKFFEYLASKRPILAVGPTDGDAAEILNKTMAGEICNFDDEEAIKTILLNYFNAFNNNSLNIKSSDLNQYSRKELCRKLSAILS